MKAPPSPERATELARLGELAREALPDDASATEDADGKRRLREAVQRDARPRSWGPVAAVVVAALSAALAFAVWPARLGYRVESSAPNAGGYVESTGHEDAVARFTEGTEVRVHSGGRARVVQVSRDGASVALEHGRAGFHVVHRPGAHWSVEAGPFSIAVTGTEFEVEWASGEGVLSVELVSGSVVVRGPSAPDGIGVRAGQHLVARVADGVMRLEPAPHASAGIARAEAAPEPSAAAETPGASRSPSPDPRAAAPPREPSLANGERAPAPPSWTRRVASGDFRGVVSDARGAGLAATFSQASLEDLVALADAARYTGARDVAQGALVAQRKRFPRTPDAKAAGFLLGRLAEDGGELREALVWYDRYLAEAPAGAFAAEALGRRLLATKKAGDLPRARSLAREYLERFPEGPHAAAARGLAAGP